jgi:site-specific DNA recombinase
VQRALGYEPIAVLPDAFYRFYSKLCDVTNELKKVVTPETEAKLMELTKYIHSTLLLPYKETPEEIGFQKMVEDVDAGFVTTIIIKDMSRIGRDYLQVGYYTDNYFPDMDVRFIAINDNVDSIEGENEMAPFRNVMNEMYARDISRKVRSAHRIRGKSGEPLSQPPYGYMKSAENKKKWVIDPEAAQVVKDIFRMCLEGKVNETIARILQERKGLVQMAYWHEKGLGRGGKKTQPNPYKWGKTTVSKILAQQEYCGDIINFKTYSKSFKNKARIPNAEENWTVFKNVHESIIDRETFEQVQKIIGKTKRRAPKPENAQKNIFCDWLYCADCHNKLWSHVNTVNKDIQYFSCSNYVKDTRETCQTRHYIRADAVEQVVMLELKRLASFLRDDEETFAKLVAQKTNKDIRKLQKLSEGELQKATMRIETVSRMYEKLYEDNVSSKVTDEWFMQLSHKYEVERVELKAKIAELKEKIANISTMQQGKEQFIEAVRKFMEIQTLTAPLLCELIDHIDVYETEGSGKNRSQRIVIYYRFVGYIEIPDSVFSSNYTADTRQGVAVEYVRKPFQHKKRAGQNPAPYIRRTKIQGKKKSSAHSGLKTVMNTRYGRGDRI